MGIEPRSGGGDDAATALAAELDAARAARDFARADAIRAELQATGWLVETGRDGTTVRRA
jgi:cysteinyl-tRNA synthetase